MKLVANSMFATLLCICMLFLCSCDKQESKVAEFIKSAHCVQTEIIYSVTKQAIKSNEYLELIVTASTNDSSTIVFPEVIPAKSFISVDRAETKGKVTASGLIEYSCRYTLEPTVPGAFTIPPFSVKTVQDDKSLSASTEEIPVTVESLFAEGMTIDIMEIEPAVEEQSYLLLVVLVIIALVLLSSIKYMFTHNEANIYRSPSKQAEYEISNLSSTDKEFAHKLRDICTSYLEKQAKIDFGAASNEEVIAKLESLRIFNKDIVELTSRLLDNINMAKFSKEPVPAQELCRLALEFLARSTVSFEVSKEFAKGEEV